MLLADPIKVAMVKAEKQGTCPIWLLDDFYTSHWDIPTLCSGFPCRECVADPEDLGPTEPWDAHGKEEEPTFWDIPF